MSKAIKRPTSAMEDPEDLKIVKQSRLDSPQQQQHESHKLSSFHIHGTIDSEQRELNPIGAWLESLSPTLRRRRHSDSAIMDINLISRQSKLHSSADLPASNKFNVYGVPLTPRPIVSEQSLSSQDPASRSIDGSYATGRSFSSNQSESTVNGVNSESYRSMNLAFNNIYVDCFGEDMQPLVRQYAEDILRRVPSQNQPGSLSDFDVFRLSLRIPSLAEADEGTLRGQMITFFPSGFDFKLSDGTQALAMCEDLPWTRLGLPSTSASGALAYPVATPKPDHLFGYTRACFPPPIDFLPVGGSYGWPTSRSPWPFLMMEFKSRSCGGNPWAAENKNAGSGSHSVNCIEKLLSYVRPAQDRQVTDSIAFSCVIDSYSATTWVHWLELEGDNARSGPKPRFVSSEVDTGLFKRVEEIARFNTNMQNILSWGIGERLDMIKGALSTIRNNPTLLELAPSVEEGGMEHVEVGEDAYD